MNRVMVVGNIVRTGNWGSPQRGRIYSTRGCAPSLDTCGGGNLEPKIILTMEIGNIYPSNGQNGAIYTTSDLSPTILSGQGKKGRGIGSCNSPKVVVYEDRPDDMPEQQG